MNNTVRTIVNRITPIDDGGLDIVKKEMRAVLGECSESTWNEIMGEVLLELRNREELEEKISSPELSFEISESGAKLEDIIEFVENKYTGWKFNRTESRYESCTMAIFERV